MTTPTYPLLIGGERCSADTTIPVDDPSTGEVIGHVCDVTPGQIKDCLTAAKQGFETPMIKDIITRFRTGRRLLEGDEAGLAAMEKLRQALLARNDQLAQEAKAAVKPLRHTLTVVGE